MVEVAAAAAPDALLAGLGFFSSPASAATSVATVPPVGATTVDVYSATAGVTTPAAPVLAESAGPGSSVIDELTTGMVSGMADFVSGLCMHTSKLSEDVARASRSVSRPQASSRVPNASVPIVSKLGIQQDIPAAAATATSAQAAMRAAAAAATAAAAAAARAAADSVQEEGAFDDDDYLPSRMQPEVPCGRLVDFLKLRFDDAKC